MLEKMKIASKRLAGVVHKDATAVLRADHKLVVPDRGAQARIARVRP
jgi:hypothetical protein